MTALLQFCAFSIVGTGSALLFASPEPTVKRYTGVGNVLNASDHNVIKMLGSFPSLQQCETACITYNNTIPGDPNPDVNPDDPGIVPSPLSGWDRCTSFTYQSNGDCYAHVDEHWQPFKEEQSTSGVVSWPARSCKSELDCSLNGDCIDGLCACDAGWEGDKCHTLKLLPAPRWAGLQAQDDGRNTSTWGGCVLQDDGLFHMWYSEMMNHCGINSCVRNSRIRHAIAADPLGPYERQEVVLPVSTHEPTVIRAPTGEIVMYFLAFEWDVSNRSMCHCHDGNTKEDDCSGATHADATSTSPRPKGGTWMTWTSHPDGPWSEPELVFLPGQWGEPWPIGTNLAVTILANGSAVGMIKTSGSVQGSTIHRVSAGDWRNVSSYRAFVDPNEVQTPYLFQQEITQFGFEDQFVYRDSRGRFHALFHNQMEFDDQRICGGHAFSLDGVTWTFGGTAFGNRIDFDDGTTHVYRRRERPHLIFDNEGNPTHLVTAVQYGAGWYSGPDNFAGDGSFTSVQPIATAVTVFA